MMQHAQRNITSIHYHYEQQFNEALTLLCNKRFNSAHSKASMLVKRYPQTVETLFLLAVSQYCLGHLEKCLKSALNVLKINNDHCRAHQLCAYIYFTQEKWPLAENALKAALMIDASLDECWEKLSIVYDRQGKLDLASTAASRLVHLRKSGRALDSIQAALCLNLYKKADIMCSELLTEQPCNPEAIRLQACIQYHLGNIQLSKLLLKRLVKQQENFSQARFDLIRVLNTELKFAAAYKHAMHLVKQKPDSFDASFLLAKQSSMIGKDEQAFNIYRAIIESRNATSSLHILKGLALQKMGDHREAQKSYREAIKLKPNSGEAHWRLTNTESPNLKEDDIANMMRLYNQASSNVQDRIQLDFAIGKAFEIRKEYHSAYRHFEKGNNFKKSITRYCAEKNDKTTQNIINSINAPAINSLQPCGFHESTPIFIVGFPNLARQLLNEWFTAQSRQIKLRDNFNIRAIHQKIDGEHSPFKNSSDWKNTLRLMGKKYVNDTHIFQDQDLQLIDAFPNNFQHIGLIHLILPHAKILHVRMPRRASQFYAYCHHFDSDQYPFSYDIQAIAQYYANYERLMQHWDTILPGRVCHVDIETIANNAPQVTEEIRLTRFLKSCGLPASNEMKASFIDYFSSHEAVGMWKHYPEFIQAMEAAETARLQQENTNVQ